MKILRHILIIALLALSSAMDAVAQEVALMPDSALDNRFGTDAVLVWQKPLPASLTGLTLAAGVSPFFSETLRIQNIFIREKVQIWRRDFFDHRQMHFDDYMQWVPLASVLTLNLVGVESRHDLWPLLRRTVGGLAISSVVTHTLKFSVDEWRPDRGSTTSFPSGHTSFAFCGAEMLRLEYGQTSPWIPAFGFVVAAMTGFMRIYNDRHWTGDVLAGVALGVVSADLSYWINDLIDRKMAKK